MVTECKYAREANFYDDDKFFPKIVTKARAKHLFFSVYLRFSVAIKSAMDNNEMMIPGEEKEKLEVHANESDLLGLLDEAKCMVTVGGYHNNIVNLQGIILEGDNLDGFLTKV